MKVYQLGILSVAAVFGLAACGSGGGSAPATTSTPSQTAPSKPAVPSKPTTPVPPAAGAVSGNYLKNGAVQQTNGSSRDVLVVDGKEIALVSPGVISGGFTNLNGNVVSGSHMSYARYGSVAADGTRYTFAQGAPTADMPANGVATYNGLALHIQNGQQPNTRGTSRFTVDFGQKTLSGTISGVGTDVDLQGAISGNTFQGTHNGTAVSGGFYGPGAAELSGTYRNSAQGFEGAFGAAK
ncbi:Slam-dependent surface lipoprotein [Neisseria leonii]|uniref:Slam-dependent surface lipoprotein n=1 Tax=Neisseria leonii TaxID=2995413 RepID=A0A9X4E8J0_9NEIS|nr:Slam-dependent surface lipoprotein [Neisseria sp. 51.81]MDD9327518.1 transferrin-binding protein-like solute binding protein [Neisseria sp. 51.81]